MDLGARLRPPRNRRFSTFNHQVCHADDDPQDLHASIRTFLYNMRISAKLQVLRLTDGAGDISALLPKRGADWEGGAGVPGSRRGLGGGVVGRGGNIDT